mmetsp:Transcript_30438/g.29822  ORF Transcript_30438/g.29822 Transcript_30438/m.29822 type:complete len:89 (-) Transcript_30438:1932-2198(-)
MWTCYIWALISGLGMPSFVYLFGEILDTLDPYITDPDEMLEDMKFLCLIMLYMGIFILVSTYLYYVTALIFSEQIAYKTRIRYLEAIL